MSIAAINPFMGEQIETAAPGVTYNWCQLTLYSQSPGAVSNTAVLASTPLTAVAQTITTGITNPDVARNVVVKGAISTSTGNVVVTGTDLAGSTITETIALNGTTAVAGAKAFATVTEIDLPVTSGAGDGVSVGIGSALGLAYTSTNNPILKGMVFNNGVRETTDPTVVANATSLCNNTITLATALAGNPVVALIVVPF